MGRSPSVAGSPQDVAGRISRVAIPWAYFPDPPRWTEAGAKAVPVSGGVAAHETGEHVLDRGQELVAGPILRDEG